MAMCASNETHNTLQQPDDINCLCAVAQLGLHTCGLTVSCNSTGLKISAPPMPWRTCESCQTVSLLESVALHWRILQLRHMYVQPLTISAILVHSFQYCSYWRTR